MLDELVPVPAKGFPPIVKLTDRDFHGDNLAANNVPPRNLRDGGASLEWALALKLK
jgi:hypothetical protein